jgi:DNA-binding MarR family transcriptional regulator
MSKRKSSAHPARLTPNTAFLLSQVGARSAELYATLLAPLDLSPADSGIVWALSRSPGISQQDLAKTLRMHPSRLVQLLDALEHRRLLERRESAYDRRLYAVHLTPEGERLFEQISRIADDHNRRMCAGLTEAESRQLSQLLTRVVEHQKLTGAVHPGFRWLGRKVRPNKDIGREPRQEHQRPARDR